MQLVINTFGASLKRKGDRFVVRAGSNRLTVAAAKVQSILVTTAVYLSSDAVVLAVSHNIDLVFLDKFGDPIARVWPPRMGSTAAIRRRQLEAEAGPEGLAIAREWIAAKLRHQAEFLEELRERRPGRRAEFDDPIATIRSSLAQLEQLDGTLDERRGRFMGLEGSAGRAYFGCLGRLLPEGYRFESRSRQPAQDGFNATLNYAYGVLYSLVDRACICAGLDPFLGFLHTDNYNKPSLVFDLIEPFRILAERATVLSYSREEAQCLRSSSRRCLAAWLWARRAGRSSCPYYNERLDRPVKYPIQGSPESTARLSAWDIDRPRGPPAWQTGSWAATTYRAWSRPDGSGTSRRTSRRPTT